MTREQRQALRESLIAQGFERTAFTNDFSGTGVYSEFWWLGSTEIVIRWGARV